MIKLELQIFNCVLIPLLFNPFKVDGEQENAESKAYNKEATESTESKDDLIDGKILSVSYL